MRQQDENRADPGLLHIVNRFEVYASVYRVFLILSIEHEHDVEVHAV